MDLNPDRITPPPENPAVGMSGKVLVHPSHICQIGESNQGLFRWTLNHPPVANVAARAVPACKAVYPLAITWHELASAPGRRVAKCRGVNNTQI